MAPGLGPPAAAAAAAALAWAAPALGSCYGEGPGGYALAWSAQGKAFFDDFDFVSEPWVPGLVGGAMTYVGRQEALADGLAEAHETHAILRAGRISRVPDPPKRRSLRLRTRKAWTHGLSALRYSHLPRGVGVWPAYFTMQGNGTWPSGGEMDLAELLPSVLGARALTSLHASKRCRLDRREVDRCRRFVPGQGLDCTTDYARGKLGCASNGRGNLAGTIDQPGVLVHEWTAEWIKVFFFPEAEIPADLRADRPEPSTWDDHVVAWYPFAASERRSPGSCPAAASLLAPQSLVFVLQLCGDGGFSSFPLRDLPRMILGRCWPSTYSTPHDCCTQFASDPANDGHYHENAFFNISWVKYYQAQGSQPPLEICTRLREQEPGAGTGVPVPCCPGAALGLNGTCLPEGWRPERCTARGLNPIWEQGWYNPCCEGLVPLVRDWDGDRNYYYRCEPEPSASTGAEGLAAAAAATRPFARVLV